MQTVEWNIRGLIEALGGVQALRHRFIEAGIEPPLSQTMIGWRRRNSAPGAWMLAMLSVAAKDPTLPPIEDLLAIMRKRAS